MADTTVHANLTAEQWDDRFFREYVRNSRFKKYTSTSPNSIITIKQDLTVKKGNKITIPLITRLRNGGVSGSQTLTGNEEEVGNYGHGVNVTFHRHGVVIDAEEEQKTPVGLRQAAKPLLMDWAMEHTRDKIIAAFGAIGTSDGENIAYASASEANKDSWLGNNLDRVLFGEAKSNTSTTDHSASLANIDNTADKLDTGIVSLAKRMATSATQRVRPLKVMDDQEWFVMFANSLAFRDLKADTVIQQAMREALPRSKDSNPIFTDGDLVWDGVIIREVPEISVITGVGASSIDVAPNYLCGAQSIGMALASRWKTARRKEDDYGHKFGLGIAQNYGVEKLFFNNVQHGVVTVYTAGVADS